MAEVVVVDRFSGEPHVDRGHQVRPQRRVDEAEVHEFLEPFDVGPEAPDERPPHEADQEQIFGSQDRRRGRQGRTQPVAADGRKRGEREKAEKRDGDDRGSACERNQSEDGREKNKERGKHPSDHARERVPPVGKAAQEKARERRRDRAEQDDRPPPLQEIHAVFAQEERLQERRITAHRIASGESIFRAASRPRRTA